MKNSREYIELRFRQQVAQKVAEVAAFNLTQNGISEANYKKYIEDIRFARQTTEELLDFIEKNQ